MTRRIGSTEICATTRKFGFESRRLARRQLRDWQGQPGFTSQAVYRCPDCGLWHLSSLKKRPAA